MSRPFRDLKKVVASSIGLSILELGHQRTMTPKETYRFPACCQAQGRRRWMETVRSGKLRPDGLRVHLETVEDTGEEAEVTDRSRKLHEALVPKELSHRVEDWLGHPMV